MSTRATPAHWRRGLALGGLVALVTLAHLGVGQWVALGLGERGNDPAPPPIDVAFVKELALAVPPVLAPPPPRRPRSTAVPVVERAASAVPASEPEPPPEPVTPEPAEAAAEPAASAPLAAASAPAAQPFDWPPSTQLLYSMEGQYRGPIQGEAEVDWLHQDERYQVRLEVRVPPLFTRRMLSDGVLGPDGLVPLRYDQETQVALQATRRETVRFEGDEVQLANGRTDLRRPGMQDIASQFVQMTWVFLTRPDRLQLGQTVDFPLALTRRVGSWSYEVRERVSVPLPFGEIDAFHLVPRKDLTRPGELSVETWVAPGLLYLPVRIVIRQDADNYLDLRLKSRPKVAVAPVPKV